MVNPKKMTRTKPSSPPPKVAGTTPPPARKKEEPRVPEYKGIRGHLTPKQKAAVDALERVTRKIGRLPGHARLSFNGSYARVQGTREGGKPRDLWALHSISYSVAADGGGGGGGTGVDWSRSEPECVGLVAAAEEVLSTHGAKPYKPKGWTSTIDDHADAVWRYELLFRLPPAGQLREAFYYLLWLGRQEPGVTLAEALGRRRTSFWGRTLKEEAAEWVDSMSPAERDRLEAKFIRDRTAPAGRGQAFEIFLKGHDPLDPETAHLRKVVIADPPERVAGWLEDSGLQDYLQGFRNLELDDAAHRQLMHAKGWDLILGGTPAAPTFTHNDSSLPAQQDPAGEWKADSLTVVAAKHKAETAGTEVSASPDPEDVADAHAEGAPGQPGEAGPG